MDVPALLAQLGAAPLPFTLSFGGGQAVLAVDLRPAAQRLGALRIDQITGSLPRTVTLRAPRTARSGALTTFTGTGGAGDVIQLYRRAADGSDVRVSGSATVQASGRFTLRARLRTSARYAVFSVQNGTFAVGADAATTTKVASP
jgi:hypothetical protein